MMAQNAPICLTAPTNDAKSTGFTTYAFDAQLIALGKIRRLARRREHHDRNVP